MPRSFFMRGPTPIRRTLQYLESGTIALRDQVRIVNVYYRNRDLAHKGAREFVFWNFPQLQYQNPGVQLLTFVNTMPTPYIEAFLESGKKVVIDVFDHSRQQVSDRVKGTLGKTEQILSAEAQARRTVANPANFGKGFPRHCICEIPGQIPCPRVICFPDHMKRKHYEDPFSPDSPMKAKEE
ncbi:putative 28S ribosomal protein S25, mitochondrial [Hypsibius exemplaris]|uniref:Small ribosomal subunit protein mS25 n=1 Tax=Hypsibius exemplaris TaxID=2072580 RepID=A0A9X6NHE3_HYPEX|nr:putative 28S ribosomal protein S25, mitochondrial [Hypsibius exemplaris]